MLKTIVSSQVLVTNKILTANEVSGIEGGNELIEKYGKLSKFQKSAKLRKKSSKSWNLPNFDTKKNGPSFLTFDIRIVFNHLRLAFIKSPIL